MKNTKKKVLVGALVVSLAAIISMGTIAWFSASDKVENKFQIASSKDDPNATFSIDVWEEFPNPADPNNPIREDGGHEYDNVMPGDELDKDVFVKNTGMSDQYVRVTVTVTEGVAWRAMLGITSGVPDLTSIVRGLNTTDFTVASTSYDSNADAFVYTLYANDILKPTDDKKQIFTDVKVPDNVTKEIAASFDGNFNVNVVADAVQTANLGDGLSGWQAAAAAFNTVENS